MRYRWFLGSVVCVCLAVLCARDGECIPPELCDTTFVVAACSEFNVPVCEWTDGDPQQCFGNIGGYSYCSSTVTSITHCCPAAEGEWNTHLNCVYQNQACGVVVEITSDCYELWDGVNQIMRCWADWAVTQDPCTLETYKTSQPCTAEEGDWGEGACIPVA